jgi:PTS system galactosamine-specific IID component
VYLALFIARIPITRLGYNLGTKAIGSLQERSQAISKSATILGVTVVGGLIASFVSIDVIAEIAISANNVVSIQSDFFDKIFPNILPFGYTMGMYYLLKNKKVNPTVLILITFGLAILLSLLGIL